MLPIAGALLKPLGLDILSKGVEGLLGGDKKKENTDIS